MASIVKRGEFQYQALVRTKGYPTQCKTFETKRDAKAWVAVIKSEQVRGVFTDRRVAEQTTLGVALERYSREVTPKKRSARSELVKIRFLIQHPLASRSLASLKSSDFSKYRDERLEVVKPNSVRLELAVLSHLFTVAKRDWSIGIGNPLTDVEKPKLPRGRDRRLEEGEEKRLLEAAAQSPTAPYLSACIGLAIETGMRASEILTLEWQEVKLSSNVIVLDWTKNGDSRVVPLTNTAVALLKALPRSLSGSVIGAFSRLLKNGPKFMHTV